MMRHLLVAALWGCGASSGNAIAGDTIYVTYGTDGTPSFSTQPYDRNSAPFLRNAVSPQKPGNSLRPTRSSDARARMSPLIRQIAEEQGLDPALVSAVVAVESGFNPDAVSPKGAIGAMQLLPQTAARYGVTDARDPQQNLTGGTRYLKDLLTTYDGNLPLALAAYNAGQGNIRRHRLRIPPYDETMLYVPKVLATMAAYRRPDAPQQ